MHSTVTCVFAAGLTLGIALTAMAAPKPIQPAQTWSGSVADVELQKRMPAGGVITDAREFAKLVDAWEVGKKAAVDFKTHLVLIETTVGSRLSVKPTLDEAGDLKVLGIATRDFAPGFRYVILSVPRDGIRTVNGKPLPK